MFWQRRDAPSGLGILLRKKIDSEENCTRGSGAWRGCHKPWHQEALGSKTNSLCFTGAWFCLRDALTRFKPRPGHPIAQPAAQASGFPSRLIFPVNLRLSLVPSLNASNSSVLVYFQMCCEHHVVIWMLRQSGGSVRVETGWGSHRLAEGPRVGMPLSWETHWASARVFHLEAHHLRFPPRSKSSHSTGYFSLQFYLPQLWESFGPGALDWAGHLPRGKGEFN